MSNYAKYRDAYANPKGAGDARPTAQDIIDQEDLRGKWTDKVVMITGASAGIGVETARAMATTGARIYLPVRSPGKAQEALRDLIETDQVKLLEVNLGSFDSVRKAAAAFLSKEKVLHVLIENAGIMAPPEGRTKDGFETQFGVNHLSHFFLLNLLKDALIAGSTPEFNSRVVILSSSAHHTSSVRQSKTANLWTANHFDRLYGSKGVHAYSLNPSVVRTSLGRFMPSEAVKAAFENQATLREERNIPQGAAVSVYAATVKELEGRGGLYLENLAPSEPAKPGPVTEEPGYAPWAFDEENEKKLWDLSLQLVGLA
ncbi:hypothetical protein NCS57_00862900 [Fusarium keratoplasticum]|uniref:Uncharacterized protein n=1 Tax=Fusarium keratoplasticum TaxID=1328300 RepID=A0ACC0QU82_9HYPO|nr:hypothetical protein NCS57_00862900 [Fusarium keratoplasticum]KAI8666384.1 hypothetical protein NCS57_00862900 [Fusarium keratoplasticum]